MTINPYSSPQSAGAAPQRKRGWPTLVEMLVILSIVGMLTALFLPARRTAREPARRSQCRNNLKNIGLGFQNYHDIHGTFPPAYVADADGKPMHSWRVLILPYMQLDDLYGRYDQSQPWDSETNRELLMRKPDTYQCPSSREWGQSTSYVVVRGKETIFDANKPCPISSITDGTANTILVIEAAHAAIPWTEPRDLDFDTFELVVNGGVNSPHSGHPEVAMALFADGRVRQLHERVAAHVLRALLTKDGGEQIDDDLY
jgi:type II secretory pathway pseudopilin PulG